MVIDKDTSSDCTRSTNDQNASTIERQPPMQGSKYDSRRLKHTSALDLLSFMQVPESVNV